jgi:hypothetical protein
MMELSLHSVIRLHGTMLNYIIKLEIFLILTKMSLQPVIFTAGVAF